jgi:hypothetical protein
MSFEGHRLACATSRRYFADYERSIRLVRGAFQDVAAARPTELPEGLVASILFARRRS